MKVSGLTLDTQTNSPILILKDYDSDTSIPIWIGLLEATSIATQLEKFNFPRPMTHDLFKDIIYRLGAKVDKIEIFDLRENTFYAMIYLSGPKGELLIDARPSDAIAIALRTDSPIFVHERVIKKSMNMDQTKGKAEVKTEEGRKWADLLGKMSPDDFGKYKM